jgi:hypothetical protein
MSRKAIIGWDLAEKPPRELRYPHGLGQILLVKGITTGEIEGTVSTQFDLWQPDPRLVIVPTFYYRWPWSDSDPSDDPEDIQPTSVQAWAIARTGAPRQTVRELFEIDPDMLWHRAGVLPDGCELATGMQGVRFKLTGTAVGSAPFDIVCSLSAIPNVALGCEELAEAILARLAVDLPSPADYDLGLV